jgi:hypothetical protein
MISSSGVKSVGTIGDYADNRLKGQMPIGNTQNLIAIILDSL